MWLALAAPVAAGAAAGATSDIDEATIAQARVDLRAVSQGLGAGALNDDEIQRRLTAIAPIQARLSGVLADLTPHLQDLQARLTQLGPPPAAGQPPEDPRSSQLRGDLTRRIARITSDAQTTRVLMLTADQVGADLSERLRANFAARLWSRNRSILDPFLWRDFAYAIPDDIARVRRAADFEMEKAAPASRSILSLGLLAASLICALALAGPGRASLNRLGYRYAAKKGDQARLRRVLLGAWLVAVAVLTPLVAGALIRAALDQAGAMTPDVDELTTLLVRAAAFAGLLGGLGRALLAPGRAEWRLAPAPDYMALRLAPFPGLIGLAAALSRFTTGLNTILGASLASRVGSESIAVVLEIAVVGGALAAVGRARAAGRAQAPEETSGAASESRLPWVLATLVAWGAVAASVAAVMFGYLALANFVMNEAVWIGAILGLLFLALRLADDLWPSVLSPKAPLGAALDTALGLGSGVLEQVGVLLSGATRLAVILLAWVAILAPFGASVEDIFTRFTAADFVVRLGLVSISPGAVIGGVAVFLVGLAITRSVRRWLEVRYLPKTGLDLGVRTSLASGVTYLGALVAILVAVAYLGLSIAQIALFASALSVGIGFGLQAIIGNFVSGLILLAERPVRVGDWIAIGDLEGDVRKISIRATEIEMLDHSRLIVPNSDLVSKTVRNITHDGALGRVRITLRVDDGADPGQVRDLLLARIKDHPRVLKEPAPGVYLTDVRDAAMEFTAFAYLASPRQAYGVKSELLFQIVPDLKAAGIALASSATVVNLGVGERLIEPAPPKPGEAD
jgi:small-conductance mechanosensitive channel